LLLLQMCGLCSVSCLVSVSVNTATAPNSPTLSGTQYYYMHLTNGAPSRLSRGEPRPVTTKLSVASDPRSPARRSGQVLSNWKGVVTSPMTPEKLRALADRIAGISSCKARFYFLVPKRQQLPPVSEELEPGSVRFLIQPFGMGHLLSRMVRSGLTMEEARAVLGGLYY
jgi:hypothetical protein